MFYWDYLEKVVRIEGLIEKISEEQSTEYFNSRPRESQIGAWASHYQSAKVSSREELEQNARVRLREISNDIFRNMRISLRILK